MILVTGAAGRIGHGLMGMLPDAVGYDLRYGEDVRDFNRFKAAARNASAVIHLAGQSDVMRSVADPICDAHHNVIGTLNVLEASRQLGIPAVIAGSVAGIYPISPYGISKSTAVAYAAHYGATALILANVYGPGMGGVVHAFEQGITAGRITIHGDGEQTRDFIHVDDVRRAFVEALSWEPGDYIVGTGEAISINELARIMVPKNWDGTITRAAAQPQDIRHPSTGCDLPWEPRRLA